MPKKLVKILKKVNQYNPPLESNGQIGDVIGIELSDPKSPRIDPKTKKPVKTFGDLLMAAEGACEPVPPEEAIFKGPPAFGKPNGYLSRPEMKKHGYSEKEVQAAFETLSGDQKKALEKLEGREKKRNDDIAAELAKAEQETASAVALRAAAANA